MTLNRRKKDDLFEYKFHYHLDDDFGSADKYFVAHDRNEASEMFGYACEKRRLHPTGLHVSKWNRWKGKWERLNGFPIPAIAIRN